MKKFFALMIAVAMMTSMAGAQETKPAAKAGAKKEMSKKADTKECTECPEGEMGEADAKCCKDGAMTKTDAKECKSTKADAHKTGAKAGVKKTGVKKAEVKKVEEKKS